MVFHDEATTEFERSQSIWCWVWKLYRIKRKEIVDYHFKNNKLYQEFIGNLTTIIERTSDND
jgi:hypothetical protein